MLHAPNIYQKVVYSVWKLSQILTVYVEICLIIYYRNYKLDK